MEGWDTRKVMRLLANGCVAEVVASNLPTGCGRCAGGLSGGHRYPGHHGTHEESAPP